MIVPASGSNPGNPQEADQVTPVTGKHSPASFTLPHQFNLAELSVISEAKEAAKSEAIKQNRGRGSGSFTRYGMMEATAEVDVIASGYGQGVDGLWRSDQVEQTFTAGSSGGFKTTVNVKAPEAVK